MGHERLTAKHRFELDNRQLMGIFAGMFLMLALFFGLGVRVGERIAEEGAERNVAMPAENAVDEGDELKAPEAVEAAEDVKKENPDDSWRKENEELERVLKGAAKPEDEVKAEAAEEEKAETKPQAEKKPDNSTVKTATAKPPGETFYTLQVHSFKQKALAERVLKIYKPFDSNKMFVHEASGMQPTWYKVCIGHFKDLDAAKAFKEQYQEKTGNDKTMIVKIGQ